MIGVLLDWDVLQPHCHDFLWLHLVDDLFFLDGDVVHYVLDLIIICAASLHWHLHTLLHVLDVTLLVRHVLDSADWGQGGHFRWDWGYFAGSSSDELSLCLYSLRESCILIPKRLSLRITLSINDNPLGINGLLFRQHTWSSHLPDDGLKWNIALPVSFLEWTFLGLGDGGHVVN